MSDFNGALYLFLPEAGEIPEVVRGLPLTIFRPLDRRGLQYEVMELGSDAWRVYGHSECKRRWPNAGLG